MIEDPALDKMRDAAKQEEGFQKEASLIKGKMDVEKRRTLSNSPIKESIGQGMERMSLIRREGTIIILMDQTQLFVPMAMREVLLKREDISHSGQNKRSNSIRKK